MLSREATLDRERRWAVPAGVSAILVTVLFLPQFFLAAQLLGPSTGLPTDSLPYIDANSSELTILLAMRALAFLAMVAPLAYLFLAAAARSDRVSKPLVAFAVIGPVLFAVSATLSLLAQTQIAGDFVAASESGGDVYNLLDDIATESGLSTTAQTLLLPAFLGLLVAMIYIPLQAMRVGLLTRFIATFGMALAASVLLLSGIVPNDVPLMFISLWFGFVGLTILDRLPGRGRPPAWDAGTAIPWPKPGDDPRPAERSAAPEDFITGEAEETTADPAAENPNAARRERAKRKRRKQRRG